MNNYKSIIVKEKSKKLQMGGELDTHIFPLSFLTAGAIIPAISSVFSPQGTAIELSSTGADLNDLIMVTDIPGNFELIQKHFKYKFKCIVLLRNLMDVLQVICNGIQKILVHFPTNIIVKMMKKN